jgi:sortase A
MRLRVNIAPMAARTLIRACFLALAMVCLGLYSYDYVDRTLYQTYESRKFDRSLEHEAAAVTAVHQTPSGRVRLPARSPLIGRLSVPRLNLAAMVREGIDGKTLKLAVGHIPATALPGQAGNVGVAAHRDTFFRGLKDLKTGDEIQFSTLNGDFEYVVESLTIVEPDNAAALAPSSENVLTLVTCYPFYYVGDAPRRFVARARQVSPPTLAQSSVK